MSIPPVLPDPDPYGQWLHHLPDGWQGKTLVQAEMSAEGVSVVPVAYAAFYDSEDSYAFACVYDGRAIVITVGTEQERDNIASAFADAVTDPEFKLI